jgi:Tfp pilus assembly protein PilN
MQELDFLPDWYHVRQERRRSYFVMVWLMVCLLGVMGVWFYLTHARIGEYRRQLEADKAERSAVGELLVRIDKERSIRDDLARKSNIAARLHSQPDALHVLGQVTDLMPEDVFISQLQLATEVIKEETPKSGGRSPRIVRRKSRKTEESRPAAPRSRYIMRIKGVASMDVSVANFIARLSAVDGFEDVRMVYTRDLVQNRHNMREFEVTFRLAEDWGPVDTEGWRKVDLSKEAAPTGIRNASVDAAVSNED